MTNETPTEHVEGVSRDTASAYGNGLDAVTPVIASEPSEYAGFAFEYTGTDVSDETLTDPIKEGGHPPEEDNGQGSKGLVGRHGVRRFVIVSMVQGSLLLVLGTFLLSWWVSGDVNLLRMASIPALLLALLVAFQIPLAVDAGSDRDGSREQVNRWMVVPVIVLVVLGLLIWLLLISS